MRGRYAERAIDKRGYVFVHSPEHPHKNKDGMVREHILVMEKALGYMIPEGYCVHHVNGNKSDNRIENLMLMRVGDHTALHNRMRRKVNE